MCYSVTRLRMLSSQLTINATPRTVAGNGHTMNLFRLLYVGFLAVICNLCFIENRPATAMVQDTNLTTISGVVLDANNARVVDTIVKIENAKVRRQVKSDDEGKFRVELPPGDYQITAEHRGFKKFEFSPFRAKPDVCELVNIHMVVESPRSTLKVN